MAQNNWEADKMLDVYIYDYLLKKNLHTSAKAFMAEGKVASDPVAIDAPGGFLFEWWSVFWDIFIARTNEKHSEAAAAYIEAQHLKAREQQQQQMHRQQVQIMQHRQAQMQLRDPNIPSLSGSISNISSESMLGQSNPNVLAARMYEERMKHPSSMESEPNSQLIDASRMALLKSSTNQGQLVHGVPGNGTATMQQIQARQQTADIKSDVNMPAAQRSLPIDQSIYGAGILPSKPGLGSPGLSQAANGLPLKGWPLTAFDQLRPGLGPQIQKPLLQSANQFQIFTPQVLAQSQSQGNLGSQNFGDIDPRRFRSLARVGLNGKDAQSTGNDGSVGSPLQSGSPKVRASSQDQAELLMKMKMSQMQQSCAQQQTSEQLQQQQSGRKRKQSASSGAANSTGTGNTAGGLATSSNQLDNMDHFGDVGSLEENVDSFLSPHNDGDPRDVLFAPLKRGSTEHNMDSSKGFSFNEVGCLRSSNSKVLCCHFSSDGKLLASAGHEKKAVLWNMDTLLTETTPDEHSHLITDIRFRPNSTQLATSSLDRTIRLWNAAEPSYCLHMFAGHNSPVMSLDFHPTKADLLCSCDGSGEIRLWSVNQLQCSRVSKGATTQVRFQPRVGQYLATAAENIVSIFDVELDKQTHKLQGHTKEVQSVCWDTNGDYLASVAEDSVRVWSLTSGWECIHEFRSSENSFHSCVFHPAYPNLLVIGGSKALELWNMADNKTLNVQAHDSVIAALAVSSASGMVASASHDKCVKIWK